MRDIRPDIKWTSMLSSKSTYVLCVVEKSFLIPSEDGIILMIIFISSRLETFLYI